MYPLHCLASKYGYHEMTILGTPRSAMTYWECRLCWGRWKRGMGAFYGMDAKEPKTLEQRVSALEETVGKFISVIPEGEKP